jgi:hypothetical protein
MTDYKSTYVITDIDSLQLLRTKKKMQYKKFVIVHEKLDANKTQKFENDLNRFHASCGCNTGNHFLSTSIVLCAIYFLITGLPDINWKLIAEILSVLVLIAVIGKVAGKILDGKKFNKTVENLYQELI